ncbi:hypothetical protein [Rhizobium leguminosarum]|uniref:hypothetical protein n=1 Tax=Rhizobium leguminosarum TaxID=384 RepID=UPI00103ACC09|nr:hypothetical protein [Rhizobium leguminosarum]TBZ95946.1 hypothetical protein E0H57_33135 [Rhizobium leguminosarum bv. viciae]
MANEYSDYVTWQRETFNNYTTYFTSGLGVAATGISYSLRKSFSVPANTVSMSGRLFADKVNEIARNAVTQNFTKLAGDLSLARCCTPRLRLAALCR